MEQNKIKVVKALLFNKSGSGNICTKLTIPSEWVKILNLSPEEKNVELELDIAKKAIQIKKATK